MSSSSPAPSSQPSSQETPASNNATTIPAGTSTLTGVIGPFTYHRQSSSLRLEMQYLRTSPEPRIKRDVIGFSNNSWSFPPEPLTSTPPGAIWHLRTVAIGQPEIDFVRLPPGVGVTSKPVEGDSEGRGKGTMMICETGTGQGPRVEVMLHGRGGTTAAYRAGVDFGLK